MEPIRVIELFAGIGAQRQALINADIPYESVGISEIDRYAVASYAAIHGPTHSFGDVTKIEKLPEADLWTYSFPCQDLSNAGLRRGMAEGSGTRSSLLWEVGRLLEASPRPEWLLMENVPAVAAKKNIRNFRRWIGALSDLGYSSRYAMLNAKDFGIPQNRSRCFMVSHLGGAVPDFPQGFPLERRLRDVLEGHVPVRYFLSQKTLDGLVFHKIKQEAKGNGFGFSPVIGDGIAHAITTGEGFHNNSTYLEFPAAGCMEVARLDLCNYDCVSRVYSPDGCSPTLTTGSQIGAIHTDGGDYFVRRLTPRECWRLMGFPDSAFDAARAARMSDTQLYRQAGNSIAVPVLSAVFRQMFADTGSCAQSSLDRWGPEHLISRSEL